MADADSLVPISSDIIGRGVDAHAWFLSGHVQIQPNKKGRPGDVSLTGTVYDDAQIYQFVRRQIRLTRLRNDLIATVWHELKTPLSSIRVLVDTLLDGQQPNPRQVSAYLQLIAKENSRLTTGLSLPIASRGKEVLPLFVFRHADGF